MFFFPTASDSLSLLLIKAIVLYPCHIPSIFLWSDVEFWRSQVALRRWAAWGGSWSYVSSWAGSSATSASGRESSRLERLDLLNIFKWVAKGTNRQNRRIKKILGNLTSIEPIFLVSNSGVLAEKFQYWGKKSLLGLVFITFYVSYEMFCSLLWCSWALMSRRKSVLLFYWKCSGSSLFSVVRMSQDSHVPVNVPRKERRIRPF